MSLDMFQRLLIYSLWELDTIWILLLCENWINLNYVNRFIMLFRPIIFFHFSMQCSAHSLQSCLNLCHPQTAAHQAPLSMGFSGQDYWSGLPCPPPRDLPDPGIEPKSLTSPPLAGGFFTTSTIWEASVHSFY